MNHEHLYCLRADHVPRPLFHEYSGFIHSLAAATRSSNAGHTVKYALVDSDPQLSAKPSNKRARLCYTWDKQMVEAADLVVAEGSFPSLGLGIELQMAAAKDTPIILCFRDFKGENRAPPIDYENPDHTKYHLQIGEGYISLMALGIPSVSRVLKYSDPEDGIKQVVGAIDLLNRG